MDTTEHKALLNSFLNRWTLENVEQMTLQDYVGVNNHDTFCYWLEHKTRKLGSIWGGSSIKFGIYKKANAKESPKQYFEDSGYLWQKKDYGNDRNTVFARIKQNILETINLSINGKFADIDNILLPNTLKWKVAFLYSNERLIPIYDEKVLIKIANSFGIKTKKISEIQNLMINQKPADLDVYQYMRELWKKFSGKQEKKEKDENSAKAKRQNNRKATDSKNTNPQERKMSGQSIIADQKHNKIQEKLKEILIAEYGKENVKLEENYVDVKLIQPDSITYFEVKSDSYASDCITKALGQLLRYSFKDSTPKLKKLFVVGQFEPNEDEAKFIDFIKKQLLFEFDYMSINIENSYETE